MTMSPYTILPAATIAADAAEAPEAAGVYVFLLNDDACLTRALADHDAALEPLGLGLRRAVYFGSTADSLRSRLRRHLACDSRGSAFRRSLGLLLSEQLDLEPVVDRSRRCLRFAGSGETRLSGWMCQHLSVAFRATPSAASTERRLIQLESPLLTIRPRPAEPHARRPIALRRYQSGRHGLAGMTRSRPVRR